MRFLLITIVLTVGLMNNFGGAEVQPALLVVIILLLLYQQFRKRDFYVVEHFLYDLNFIEYPGTYGKPFMRVERGPMLGHACRRLVFL
jgi:hypothetical protein